MADGVSLRPITEEELPLLIRFLTDPTAPGEFQWFGFRTQRAKELEDRWLQDGLIGGTESWLAVVVDDGTCAGWVDWRESGNVGRVEIGIALFAEWRGKGIGTEAQRQLIDYLFTTTPIHRIWAATDVDNIAEQRALERVGFRREGLHRGWGFRAGAWRDALVYGLVRPDWEVFSLPTPED